MASTTPNDKVAKLKVYADGLKQRLSNKELNKELRFVLEIDLRKTEAKIVKLTLS